MPFTAILHRFYWCRTVSCSNWGRFHAFQWVCSDSRPPPALPFCLSHRRCFHFLPLPKIRIGRTQASRLATIKTQRRRFGGASEVPPPNTRSRYAPVLPVTPWPSRKSSYRQCPAQWAPPHHIHWRVGQFCRSVGSTKILNQQWLRTHLVWHLKCNLIWTSTANSLILPQRLLTIWVALRHPKVNSLSISFSLSSKKSNKS